MEVKRLGGESRFVHPSFPVNSGKNLVCFEPVVVKFNEFLPCVSEVNCLDAGEEVLRQVVLEEYLHLCVPDQGIHEGKELEALFIGNLCETVVGVVTFKNWVE